MLLAGMKVKACLAAGVSALSWLCACGVDLPATFRSLEWIQSTGTQYIDTGYIHDAATKVTCSVLVEQAQPATWTGVFGARESNYQKHAFVFFAKSGKTNSAPVYNRSGVENFSTGIFPFGARTTIVCEGALATWQLNSVDSASVTTTGTLDGGVNPMFIFTLNTAASGGASPDGSWCRMKLYSFVIENALGRQRDFVPCRRLSDLEVGLFDRVEGKFYTNAGTGTFVGSDDEDVRLSWVASSGTQYINTGYLPQTASKYEIGFHPLAGNAAWTSFFGVMENDKPDTSVVLRFYNDTGKVNGVFCNASYGEATTPSALVDADVSATLQANRLTVNGADYPITTVLPPYQSPILLFAESNNGALRRQAKMRLSSFRISEGETVKRDFVPYRTAAGVVGVYDLQNRQFYANAGSGAFTWGGIAYQTAGATLRVFEGTLEAAHLTAYVADCAQLEKAGLRRLDAAAVTAYPALSVAEGTLALQDGVARTCSVAGALKLAGGTRLVLDVTADGCDRFQAGTVDLSAASAEHPVTLEFAPGADAVFGADGKMVVIAGGLSAGDEAKFRAEGGLSIAFAVENGALVATMAADLPLTARWTGAGDRANVNDSANWICRNAAGTVLEGARPTNETTLVLDSPTTFNWPAGQVLPHLAIRVAGAVTLADACDWRGFALEDLPEDFTLDLNGHDLKFNWSATPRGTWAVNNGGAPAELVLTVPADTTAANGETAFTGALSIVKDGAGTFVWSQGTLARDIPLAVTNGVFRLGVTTADVFGTNGTVTVANKGQFDLNIASGGQSPVFNRTFYIAGEGPDGSGAIVNTSTTKNAGNHLKSVILVGDATIGGTARIDFRGAGPVLDAGDYTLTVKNTQMLAFCAGDATLKGKHVVVTDGGILQPCGDGCKIEVTDPIELKNGGVFASWSPSSGNNKTWAFDIAIDVSAGEGQIRSDAYWFNNRKPVTVEAGATLDLGKNDMWYSAIVNHGTLNAGSIASASWRLVDFLAPDAAAGLVFNDGLIDHTAGNLRFGSEQTANLAKVCCVTNNGTIRTSGGTFSMNAASVIRGSGVFEFAGGSPVAEGDFSGFAGTVRLTGGSASLPGLSGFNGKLVLVDGKLATSVAGYPCSVLIDLAGRTQALDFDRTEWGAKLGTRSVVLDLRGRTLVSGEKLLSWSAPPEGLTFVFDEATAQQGRVPYATNTGLYFGDALDAAYVDAARWTGAAGNGDFSDPANWSCVNVRQCAVPGGVPYPDTVITLDADVPPGGWAGFDTTTFRGGIDLNGHRVELPFAPADPAPEFAVVNDAQGDPCEVHLFVGAGTNYVNTAVTFSGNISLVKDGEGAFTWGGGTLAADIPLLITNGVFRLGVTTANVFGDSGTIKVAGKGQFDINYSVGGGSSPVRYKAFEIEGDGPDGSGALYNSATAKKYGYHVSTVVLTGDATIGGISRFDFRGNGCGITGSDYVLTTKNLDMIAFCGGTTHLDVKRVVCRDGGVFQPCSDGGTIAIAEGVEILDGGRLIPWNGNSKTPYALNFPVTVGAGGGSLSCDSNAYVFNDVLHVTDGGTLSIGRNNGTLPSVIVDGGSALELASDAGTITVTDSLVANGRVATQGGTLYVTGSTSGAGTLACAGGALNVTGSLMDFSGTFRLSNGTASLATLDQSMGTLVLSGGTLEYRIDTFLGDVVIDLTEKTGPFQIDGCNWYAYLGGRTVMLDLEGRLLAVGDKLLHWSRSPNATYFMDPETAALGVTLQTTTTGVYYGVDSDSTDVATATWTGLAGDGRFSSPGNWMCYNFAKRPVLNAVPTIDTAITLAADVPSGAWTDFIFDSFIGSINLTGHRLTLYGRVGNSLSAFNITDTARGCVCFEIPEGVEFINKHVTFGGNLTFLKEGPGTFTWAEGSLPATVPIAVSNGVFNVGITTANAFGTAGTITVGGQGQFDLNLRAGGQSPVFSRTFYIAGDGPDGQGAIVNTSTSNGTGNHLKSVILTGDATIGGRSRIDFRGTGPVLDTGAYTLTIKNTSMLAFCGGDATLRGKHVIVDGGVLQPCSDGCVISVTDPVEVKNGGVIATWAKGTTYSFNIPFEMSEGTSQIRTDWYWFNNTGAVTVNVGAELSLGNEGGWYKTFVNHGTVSIGAVKSNAWLRNYDYSNKQPGTLLNDGLIVHTAGILALGSDQNATWKSTAVNDGTIRTSGGTFIINAASSMSGAGILEVLGGTPTVNGSLADFTGTMKFMGGDPRISTIGSFPGTLQLVDGVATNTPLADFRGKVVIDLAARPAEAFNVDGRGWMTFSAGTCVWIDVGKRRLRPGDQVLAWSAGEMPKNRLRYRLTSGQVGELYATGKGVFFTTGMAIFVR